MEQYTITINGKAYEVEVNKHAEGEASIVSRPEVVLQKVQTSSSTGTPVTAPMPGSLFDIVVNEGERVEAGQVILILEAMKMENEIMAPISGRIASIGKQKGDSIKSGDVLAIIE